MIDSLTTVPTFTASASDLFVRALPYTTPWSLALLVMAWFFRVELKVWMTSRSFDRTALVSDVAALKDNLAKHTGDEARYWKENDASFTEQGKRIDKLELTNVELRVTLTTQHEEVMRSIGEQNVRIGELTRELMRRGG
jgi:hypothetical protein